MIHIRRNSGSLTDPMNSPRRVSRSVAMLLTLVGLVLGAMPLFAQAGFPIDWSSKHVVYTPAKSLAEWEAVRRDPRALYQEMMRNKRLSAPLASEERGTAASVRAASVGKAYGWGGVGAAGPRKNPMKVDWSVSLGNLPMAQNMSPAKYSFITSGTPSCSDWVVYGLNGASSATQATLMAVNNLYGTANGCAANPTVLFAYETAGPITTSPVISFADNGLQVAYVDNEGGKATLVVVKYGTVAGNGTSAAAPVAVPGTGTQVKLTYSATTNTNSPVYVAYFDDTAYVGDDGGTLYAISPVFGGGTPAVVAQTTGLAGQPAGILTGPVLDQLHGVVLVGSSNGNLYALSASSLAAFTGSPLAVGDGSTTGGIVDPPVIVTGGTTYAFTTTACNPSGAGFGAPAGILNEASLTNATLASVASPNISDAHGCDTVNNLHAPSLDDAVYNGSAGFLYVCGTVKQTTTTGGSEAPVLYSLGFNPTSGVLGSVVTGPNGSATATDECSPVTYFTSNSTQKIFFGTGTAASTGSINSSTVSAGTIGALTTDASPGGLGGTSGIIVDNSSSTASLANVYFGGLQAGNVGSGTCVQNVSVTSASTTGTTVSLNGSFSTNFVAGDTVIVSGFTGSQIGYNGSWQLTSATATTLQYSDSSGTGSSATGIVGKGVCAFQLTQSALN
jgi:hypothetical protein